MTLIFVISIPEVATAISVTFMHEKDNWALSGLAMPIVQGLLSACVPHVKIAESIYYTVFTPSFLSSTFGIQQHKPSYSPKVVRMPSSALHCTAEIYIGNLDKRLIPKR
jgi:hypothetical protein